uniref:DAN domain family, member 5 n=1 Tax=Oryzias latipes TaxID=8090 RepID=A0A3P9HIV8_ORYLA
MSPGQRQSTDSKVAVWSLGPQPAEEFQDFSLVSTLFLIKDMTIIIRVLLFLSLTSTALLFPYNSLQKEPRVEFESSGSSPNEPVQGIIKVVQLDPGRMSPSMFFRRGLPHRRALSPRSRVPFPAFLSRGRPGLASAPRAPVSPLHNLSPQSTSEMELKKNQGLHMWQKVIDKGDKMKLPVNLKDTKQTCTAVSFEQHVTADGCQTVRVHNKLCFGQCSSLFVPSEGEVAEPGPGTGAFHHRAPCTRCAPVKARTVTVPLRCGAGVREKRVMVVEECKCETSREQRAAEAAASTHL